ncbi:MAG: hypothetical protein KGZ72_05005, partial [Roseovarius sp.]|nr:hypothetical protein [Roseovarius sp.]
MSLTVVGQEVCPDELGDRRFEFVGGETVVESAIEKSVEPVHPTVDHEQQHLLAAVLESFGTQTSSPNGIVVDGVGIEQVPLVPHIPSHIRISLLWSYSAAAAGGAAALADVAGAGALHLDAALEAHRGVVVDGD